MFQNFSNPNLTTGDAFFMGVVFTLLLFTLLTIITALWQRYGGWAMAFVGSWSRRDRVA
jgi:hypothetical protein